MPTLEITLNPATYASLRQAALQRRQSLELVVEDALAAFLHQPARPIQTTNGDLAPDRAGIERRAKIRAEAEAWRSLPDTVRQSYGLEFVAVHEGHVIDHDADRLALYRRVRQRLEDTAVLITPAAGPSPREFRIASPRLERPS